MAGDIIKEYTRTEVVDIKNVSSAGDILRKLNVIVLKSNTPEVMAAKIEQSIIYNLATSLRIKYSLTQKFTEVAMRDIAESIVKDFKDIYDSAVISTSLIQYIGRGFIDPTNSIYNIYLLISSAFNIIGNCRSFNNYFDNFSYLYKKNLDIQLALSFDEEKKYYDDRESLIKTLVNYLENKLAISVNIKQNQIANPINIDCDSAINELKLFYDNEVEDDPELAAFLLKRIIIIGFTYVIGKRKSLMNDIADKRGIVIIERLCDIYLMLMVQWGFGTNDDYSSCRSILRDAIAAFIINSRLNKLQTKNTTYPYDFIHEINFYPNSQDKMDTVDNYTKSYMAIASKVNHSYCIRSDEHRINNEECKCDVF